MKNNGRLIFILFLGVVLLGAVYAVYMYNKPHRDIAKEKPAYELAASALYQEFEENESAASKKYVDQVILVDGIVKGVQSAENGIITIALEDDFFGVTCTIDSLTGVLQNEAISLLQEGDSVRMKGRCDGMLTDVKLSKCMLVEE